MWLLLLTQLLQKADLGINASLVSPALAIETSSGPTSPQEAEILWKDGKTSFETGDYQNAVDLLQRLVDRYPGYTGYLEAQRLLGRSLMLLGKPDQALKPLRYYASSSRDQELGNLTKLWIGDDYLLLSKPNEAYLIALEVEKSTKSSEPMLYARSQFLKARALIGMNQDERAQRVIDSIESAPIVQSDTELKGTAAQARIDLKLRKCAKYPVAKPMEEDQARDQFSRRALCLQEALVLFKAAAESKDSGTGKQATDEIFRGFSAYTQAVRTPPSPPKLRPTDRTAKQKEQYLRELSDRLEQDRRKAFRDSLQTLADWKRKAAARAATAYANLMKKIESLI